MRKGILIFDTIVTILMAVCVIINVFEGDFGGALLWNLNFTVWLFNTGLDLVFGKIEKTTMKSKEEDNEK